MPKSRSGCSLLLLVDTSSGSEEIEIHLVMFSLRLASNSVFIALVELRAMKTLE